MIFVYGYKCGIQLRNTTANSCWRRLLVREGDDRPGLMINREKRASRIYTRVASLESGRRCRSTRARFCLFGGLPSQQARRITMARYLFFKYSRSTFGQISELFDFIWPTAAALWNLRWQV